MNFFDDLLRSVRIKYTLFMGCIKVVFGGRSGFERIPIHHPPYRNN